MTYTHADTACITVKIYCNINGCCNNVPLLLSLLVRSLLSNSLTDDGTLLLYDFKFEEWLLYRNCNTYAHSWIWGFAKQQWEHYACMGKICNWHLKLFAKYPVKLQRDCGGECANISRWLKDQCLANILGSKCQNVNWPQCQKVNWMDKTSKNVDFTILIIFTCNLILYVEKL